ncbi:DEAD/DEAH box helicase [Prosthecobacter vanneervenii]|uniref:Putative helicase n=1 Tax=Prosthecobacter vanneervenii TaxID=48466 RepID=A0A7W7YDC1_9BACT|nr:type ISP restriction/modification enzyme [Prosthecobacter vanneervenii]MBB5034073.1 putative helicase [Prosthecobacter vanneervenii]
MPSSPLQKILAKYRATSQTEREKGTYFEELIRTYFRFEASYADLYSDVWLFADWAKEIGTPEFGISAKDTGIDLVARTRGTEEYHAIQCKCYAPDYRVMKGDIDSFFTASGKKCFAQRIIVATTNDWSDNAENALSSQQPPVYKIDLHDLEVSQIDWAKYQPSKPPALKPKKQLRPHQITATTKVGLGFKSSDRGKLIMACGTGKTFTSLKIAEEIAGKNKVVLFLVPSLNLLSQSLTEWTQESAIPLHSFAVCSDAEVGKKREQIDEDIVETFAHELRYPATTDAKRLAFEVLKRHDAQHMSVIFSTYHSLDVLSRAQNKFGLPQIDLVICDEAHRTTGATFDTDDKESNFVRVHDNDFLKAARRLYMTATPRIYADSAKAQAEKENIAICSMDDEALYGKQFHVITFSEAVELKLLTDYKVLVLTISEDHVSSRLQNLLKDENNQLKVDDAARIIGCWKALSKQGLSQDLNFDPSPMKRAVAFCQVIERQKGAKTHKVSSKQIASMFKAVVDAYQEKEDSDNDLLCEAEHVDGTMNAAEKEEKLSWLKAEPPPNTCRILSNVRCLSEGVDVPALDAVLFLTPRNSQVDVVQSVGRVMRTAPGKQLGYVILPVVIPSGMEPHEALNDNKVYKVVWDVLQALRSHDDRFDAFVNKLDLIGKDPRKMEVIAITDKINKKSKKAPSDPGKDAKGGSTIGQPGTGGGDGMVQGTLKFEVGELERALNAKLVKKCGNRNHWEDWANDIAKIAQTHISRISGIVLKNDPNHKDPKTEAPKIVNVDSKEGKAFQAFAHELRDDLNDSITDTEVIEMLAQHLITKPVFDALFKDYSFAKNNPVSQAMQGVLDVLQEHRLEKEADTLEKFYASVANRAEGIDNAEGKQKIVVELYDKFFRNAFPKMTERLGIVYTPVEVVDFIIHSINDLLQSEFGQTLGSKGVHIIDPFTGTGTFITRLLQSGLIKPEELPWKYKHEIHANEIVLLAYYIAAINIEAVYHSLLKDNGTKYQPFEGICLTDTFRMGEEDLVSELMAGNSERRKRQQKLEVRVIMGNPPYSVGQTSENDNAANIEYPALDERIRSTYADKSSATLQKGLYDSYIRAIRWASDRVGRSGIIGFVTNGNFLEVATNDGLRRCLAEEFSRIYVFHLRGNARTTGEQRRKEKDNVFGQASRAPIAISLLVKNPAAYQHGKIYFHDIGDYLGTEEKLQKIAEFASVTGITNSNEWRPITPDAHGDWLKQRDESFSRFVVLGDKKGEGIKIFNNFSLGVVTNRDSWCYNASKSQLEANVNRIIDFYNGEVDRFNRAYPGATGKARAEAVDGFVNTDRTKISWTRSLKAELVKDHQFGFEKSCLTRGLYRPFTKQWLYFNRRFNEMVYQMPRIFPNDATQNLVIGINGKGSRNGFTSLISDRIVDLNSLEAGAQCFPLYFYEKTNDDGDDGSLFAKTGGKDTDSYTRRDGISDAGLAHFQAAYPAKGEGGTITKEDLFYYIYGLLHSPDYRSRYADNLGKELPRIPAVKTFADFRAFSKAGRDLAHWHLNYETVAPYAGATLDTGKVPFKSLKPEDYRVVKMKFAKTRDPETNKSINDKTTVFYNDRITIRDIPLEAYDYVVNGKTALEWVMERQAVSVDDGKGGSGIMNDANLWATETMGNAKYPLELFLRVITVSLETMKIVNSLPKLENK